MSSTCEIRTVHRVFYARGPSSKINFKSFQNPANGLNSGTSCTRIRITVADHGERKRPWEKCRYGGLRGRVL